MVLLRLHDSVCYKYLPDTSSLLDLDILHFVRQPVIVLRSHQRSQDTVDSEFAFSR